MKIEKMRLVVLLVIAGVSNVAVLPSLAQITAPPTDQSVNTGGTAAYTVADATATAYQWQLNGVNLTDGVNANGSTYAGSTNATLTIAGVTPQDAAPAAAGYACAITDGTGSPVSSPVALVVRLVRFAFDEANTGSNYLTASDPDSGVNTSLIMLNGSGVPADSHGPPNSGVNGIGQAFNLSGNATQPDGTITGPVAVTNNAAALGFNTLGSFTVTEWFMIGPGATALIGGHNPRLWIMGPGATTDDTISGAFGLKLGDGGTGLNGMKANLDNDGDLNNDDGSYIYWAAAATSGTWFFTALTYDGTNLTYYIGDTNETSAAFGADTVTNATFPIGTNGAVLIGNRTSDFARSLAGWIDDARFFSGVGAGVVENARLLALIPGPAVTITATNTNQVSLSWSAIDTTGMTGPVTYNVKRANISGGPYMVVAGGAGLSGTSFTDTTLAAGRTYYYVVAPFNSAGEGNIGAEAAVTTAGAVASGGVTLVATLNPGKTVTLSLTGMPGVQYHAQVASNLTVVPVLWMNLPGSASLAASPGGAWSFTDPNTGSFSPRFYRAVSP